MEDPFNPTPTLVLLDIPAEDQRGNPHWEFRAPTPSTPLKSNPVEKNEPADIYGLHLLRHLCSSIQQRTLSQLIVPIPVLGTSEAMQQDLQGEPSLHALAHCATSDAARMAQYLDMGAADVLNSPFTSERVSGLPVHAYRALKDLSREETSNILTKRNRKLSWIGVDEDRPFAYLREAMVSGLMSGICNPESVNDTLEARYVLVHARYFRRIHRRNANREQRPQG